MAHDHPCTYICTDKDCRRSDGYSDLMRSLKAVGKIHCVDCQDLCDGPVAGVEIDGRVEWFERLRKPRHRNAVIALAVGAERSVPKDLRSHWEKKRSGKVKH